jgi:hypothetical protein
MIRQDEQDLRDSILRYLANPVILSNIFSLKDFRLRRDCMKTLLTTD